MASLRQQATSQSPQPISDEIKAGWAVAYADQTRNRELGPALRKAYKPGAGPDKAAMYEALEWARSIVSALERGYEMLP